MIKITLILALTAFAAAIPYMDQIALVNSLVVGKDEYQDLVNWNCKPCDSSNKPIHAHVIEQKEKDVKCTLAVYDTFTVLAFRFTNTALNVWQDILYPLQIIDEHMCGNAQNCKVQKAYHTMWETIKLDVLADLKRTRSETGHNTLYITGISMGGGLTVISYVDIAHEKIYPNVKMTTFGAPRVGNKHWAAHFDNITNFATRRYFLEGDEITVLPRCLTLLCTYRQTGYAIECFKKSATCKHRTEEPDDDITLNDFVRGRNYLDEDKLGNIIQHANDYPLLYNMTLIS